MDSAFTLSTVVAASKSQVSANMGGEEVILDLSAGVYYGLDAVGARVWELLRKPCTVASIRQTIVAEYNVEADQCLADLQALLDELQEMHLIEVGASDAR